MGQSRLHRRRGSRLKRLGQIGAIALICGLCLIACTSWRSLQAGVHRDAVVAIPTVQPAPSSPPAGLESPSPRPASAPRVEGDRLWADLEPFSQERFGAGARSQARAFIKRSLEDWGWQVDEAAFEGGINVVATWPPSAQSVQKTWLVGAHYDTVPQSPGTNDNGTGVAAVLEIGRLYGTAERGAGERGAAEGAGLNSLMLVLFDREEQGLLGSFAFATPERLARLQGAVILDMLGATCDTPGCQQYPELLKDQAPSDRGDFIAIVGDAEHPALLKAFEQAADPQSPPVYTLPVPFKGLLTPDVLRSDHAPFWLGGLGAVLVSDTGNLRNPHYHQPTDTLEQVNREFFVGVTQQVVNGLWALLSAAS